MLSKNPETVKLVFMNLPLNFHKMAFPSAVAALAAGEQGKFWEYHDRLFAEKKITQNSLTVIAASMGLDMEKFERDRKSPAITGLVRKDIAEAKRLGITGTPTVFINGRKLKQRSLAGFQTMINEEIRRTR